MTFTVRIRGDRSAAMVCVYTCETHGPFDAEVQRDANGDPPDVALCPIDDDCHGCGGQCCSGCKVCDGKCHAPCGLDARWTPSADVGCRVRRVEVTRGKWEKPERKTYLDTRKLGEGQDPEEFRAERKAMWDQKRRDEAYRVARE
jgi:hypothetical protein